MRLAKSGSTLAAGCVIRSCPAKLLIHVALLLLEPFRSVLGKRLPGVLVALAWRADLDFGRVLASPGAPFVGALSHNEPAIMSSMSHEQVC